MKSKTQIVSNASISISGLAVLTAAVVLSPSFVLAQSGNWNIDNAGNWSVAGNWNPAAVPGNAAGDVVGLNNNITNNRIVTINTTSRTVGTLNIGDSNNTHAFTLATSGGGTLTFDNSGGGASLNESGSVVDVINAPIILNDSLAVSVAGGLILGGSIAGVGNTLTKTGAGTLTISGNNTHSADISSASGLTINTAGTSTFSGNLTVSGGTLSVSSAATTLAGTGLLTLSGGMTLGVPNSGVGTVIDMDQRWDGNFNTTLVSASGQTITNNGSVTLGANVTVGNKATIIVSNGIGQSGGARNLTITNNTGSNTFIINGASSYTGTTTLSQGVLRLGHVDAISSSSSLSMATNTTLGLRSNAAATFNMPGSADLIFSSTGTYGATIDVGNNGSGTGNTLTLGTGITSNAAHGNVVTLNFTGANSYLLNIPTLTHSVSGSGGSGGGLTLNPTTTSVTIGNMNIPANNKVQLLTLGGTSSGNSVGTIFQTTLTNAVSLTKSGAGTWTLTGANNFAGAATINGGVLEVSVLANGGLDSGVGRSAATNTNLNIANGATLRYIGSGHTSDRAFRMTGSTAGNNAIIEASGAGAITFSNTAAVTNQTNNIDYTLQLSGTNIHDNTLAANIGDNGTGLRSLTKEGSGKWILTGSSGYTGATLITDGTLLVNGSLTSALNDVIVNGGILGGNGSIAGTVSVNAATIAPGTSPGTLTITNSLSFGSTSLLAYELNAGNQTIGSGINDLITGVTDLTLDGTLNVTSATLSAGTWRLINYSPVGSFTNNILDIGTISLAANHVASIDTTTAGQVNLVVSLVPEPSSLAMLAFGMVSFWLFKRR